MDARIFGGIAVLLTAERIVSHSFRSDVVSILHIEIGSVEVSSVSFNWSAIAAGIDRSEGRDEESRCEVLRLDLYHELCPFPCRRWLYYGLSAPT